MMTREQLLQERIGYCALQADTINSELMALKQVPSNSSTERRLRLIETCMADALEYVGRLKDDLPKTTAVEP